MHFVLNQDFVTLFKNLDERAANAEMMKMPNQIRITFNKLLLASQKN